MTRSPLSSIKAFLEDHLRRQIACEGCGNEFTCGASLSGCWCAKVELSESARAELRLRYSDCLCSDCLKKFEQAEK